MERTVTAADSLSNGSGNSPLTVATHVADLPDAIYNTARAFNGGARALSRKMLTRDKLTGELVPMKESTFAHKVNPNCTTQHVTLEEARDMMVLSDDFRILYSLAADTNHVVIQTAGDTSGMTFERISAMAKEFGDVVGAATEAQAAAGERGTRVSPNEAAKVEREAAELMAALNALVVNMRAQATEVR